MDQLPTLDGPRLQPATGRAPEQLAMMLHGVGADGNDLIGLAPFFQRTLPGALFVSPHAPYPFDMAPTRPPVVQPPGLRPRGPPRRHPGGGAQP